MTSFLGKSRIIDNQYSLGIGSLCKHPSPIFAKCTVMVPLDFCQQPLHLPFRGVDLLRHRLNRLPVPIHHQPDDITLRQLSGFRSLNVRRINRHVVIYTEKYVLCFHEGCISHPLPFCNIICRSSTNYTNNLQAILVKDKNSKRSAKLISLYTVILPLYHGTVLWLCIKDTDNVGSSKIMLSKSFVSIGF